MDSGLESFVGFVKRCRRGSELRCEVSNRKFKFVGFAGLGAAKGRWISISFQHGCDGVGGRATFNVRIGGAQSSQPFRIAGNLIFFGYKFCGRSKRAEKGYGHSCKCKFSPQSKGVMSDALNPICSSWKNFI